MPNQKRVRFIVPFEQAEVSIIHKSNFLNNRDTIFRNTFNELLQQFDDLFNKKVQRAKNAWLEHVEEYKKSHLGISHKTAITEAKKTYVKKKVMKTKKSKKIYNCEYCEKNINNKSNLNRHLKEIHYINDAEKALLEVASCIGKECKFRRILKGVIKKDTDRILFEIKHVIALKAKEVAIRIYKIAANIKTDNTEDKVIEPKKIISVIPKNEKVKRKVRSQKEKVKKRYQIRLHFALMIIAANILDSSLASLK